MTTARLDAARLLGQLMATPDGREVLKDVGHESGMPIVLIEHYETIESLVDRARKHVESVVLVGIHYEHEHSMAFITLAPSGAHAKSHERAPVDPSCQVGMLFDLLQTAEESLTIRLSRWDPKLDIHAASEPIKVPV